MKKDGNIAQYFESFLMNEITDLILHETNCYAEQFLARHNLSDIFWKRLTAEELSVFQALIILQGIIKKRKFLCIGRGELSYSFK